MLEKLTTINIDPNNPRYSMYDNGKLMIGKSSIESEKYDVLLFADRSIKCVTIPSCNAFEKCQNLKKSCIFIRFRTWNYW